ncbi:hypothetical protein O2V63_12135 [Modestobacter sp. VKM Ac-2977]|uniref:hypothetical protein n=1 Tax=Modestobacter sp. VKM Ac-2977 TaxID=3004131 RepID=UPI0022AAA6D8|nr:hypothetical protein [Modestobacter sp. VKM Ac-2977]MCZ2821082.1 hypothetical protein [Modestobacter sp. VKM Ac-2977]
MATATRRTAAGVAAMVLAVTACSTSAAPELAAFDRPATNEDAVPEYVDVDPQLDEVRYIGAADGALVYAAQGQADQPWCVLVVVPRSVEGGDWVAGSSCAGGDDFAQGGVRIAVRDAQGREGEALLLPDDFTGEVEAGWEIVEPNLAVPVES